MNINIGSTEVYTKSVAINGAPVVDATGTWSLQDMGGTEIANGTYSNNLDGTYDTTLSAEVTSSLTQYKRYKIISIITDSEDNVSRTSCTYTAVLSC